MSTRHDIYRGLDFLGEVVEQANGNWLAVGADGRKVGRFPDRIAAASALSGSIDKGAAVGAPNKGAQLAPPSETGEAA